MKKILAIVMILVLLFSMFVTTALAAPSEGDDSAERTEKARTTHWIVGGILLFACVLVYFLVLNRRR